MKITLNLNDTLLIEAKALAAQQRTSLTRLIEEGLRLRLRLQARPSPGKSKRLPVYRGKGGLAPGLSGLSNKAMLDAAEAGSGSLIPASEACLFVAFSVMEVPPRDPTRR